MATHRFGFPKTTQFCSLVMLPGFLMSTQGCSNKTTNGLFFCFVASIICIQLNSLPNFDYLPSNFGFLIIDVLNFLLMCLYIKLIEYFLVVSIPISQKGCCYKPTTFSEFIRELQVCSSFYFTQIFTDTDRVTTQERDGLVKIQQKKSK